MSPSGECFFGIAFVFYFLAGVLYLGGLFVKAPQWAAYGRVLARIGFAGHTLAIYFHGMAMHRAPFTDAWESLSFFAWILLLLFLVLDWRTPLASLGAFVTPICFLALFFAAAQAQPDANLSPTLRNHALDLHIAVCLMSYGAFALSFCAALVYLIQENRLKRKRFDVLFKRLLPLEQADVLANRMVGIGFALLTLGILMGLNFAARVWTGRWWTDPKIVSSFLTWLTYAFYLYTRSVAGWRGRRTMLLLVAGFGVVLIGYVGINMSGLSRHPFPL